MTAIPPRASRNALLFAALFTAAGASQAQSDLLVYGRLDVAQRQLAHAYGDGLREIPLGAASASRRGVRGSEDLGGGLKVILQVEGNPDQDPGTAVLDGRLPGRASTLGLAGDVGPLAFGHLTLNGFYRQIRNVNPAIDRELYSVGGTYRLNAAQFSLSYMRYGGDTTPQENRAWAGSLSYALTSAIDVIGGLYYDRQRAIDGGKKMGVIAINYKLSRRSNVYFQADRGNVMDAYIGSRFDEQGLGYALQIRNRNSVSVGLRHQF
ncbi:MAG: porin [Pseudomonadota bacterium]